MSQLSVDTEDRNFRAREEELAATLRPALARRRGRWNHGRDPPVTRGA